MIRSCKVQAAPQPPTAPRSNPPAAWPPPPSPDDPAGFRRPALTTTPLRAAIPGPLGPATPRVPLAAAPGPSGIAVRPAANVRDSLDSVREIISQYPPN